MASSTPSPRPSRMPAADRVSVSHTPSAMTSAWAMTGPKSNANGTGRPGGQKVGKVGSGLPVHLRQISSSSPLTFTK